MEPPAAGRRHDAWILGRLLQTIGLPSPLDAQSDAYAGRDMIQSLLSARALTIDTVQAAPHSTVVFPEQPRDILASRCLPHADPKLYSCPASLIHATLLQLCDASFAGVSASSTESSQP